MLGSKLVVINLNQQVLFHKTFSPSPRVIAISYSSHLPQALPPIYFQQLIHFTLQTDSSDLLGNWKPVDVRVLIRPAVAEFESLFESTLSSRANTELLTQLRLRLDKGKHSDCIKIMSKGKITPISKQPFSLIFCRFQSRARPYFEENIGRPSRRSQCKSQRALVRSATAMGRLAGQDIKP